jgi:hypothetical protein
LPDLFSYEVSVFTDPIPGRATRVGFCEAFGNQGPFYNFFGINSQDGLVGIVNFKGDLDVSGTYVGAFTVGEWVSVRADLDFTTLTADLWLNGVLTVTDFPILPKEPDIPGRGIITLNKWGVTEYNWLGGGTGVIYVDDVNLSIIPAPSAILLTSFGTCLIGWLRKRKKL